MTDFRMPYVPGYALETDCFLLILLVSGIAWIRDGFRSRAHSPHWWLAGYWCSLLVRLLWLGCSGWLLFDSQKSFLERLAIAVVAAAGSFAACSAARTAWNVRTLHGAPGTLAIAALALSRGLADLWFHPAWGYAFDCVAIAAIYLPPWQRSRLTATAAAIVGIAPAFNASWNDALWPVILRASDWTLSWEHIMPLGISSCSAACWYFLAFRFRPLGRLWPTALSGSAFVVLAMTAIVLGDRELRRQKAFELQTNLALFADRLGPDQARVLLHPNAPDSPQRRRIWDAFCATRPRMTKDATYYFMALRGENWWFPLTLMHDWASSVRESEIFYREKSPFDGWLLPGDAYAFLAPFRDGYGVWVTATVPVYREGGDRLLMCTDVSALRWAGGLMLLRLPSLGAMSLGLLCGAFWFRSRARHADAESARLALATASHELRTPLQALLGYSDLLRLRISSGEEAAWTEAIHTESRYLSSLIRQLLDLSALQSGILPIRVHPCDLRAVVRDLGNSFARAVKDKGLVLDISVDDALPAWVEIDGIRVRQVLSCLLSNAIRYTDAGRGSVEVTHDEPGFVRLVVRDTGKGIDARDRARVFKPFQRGAGNREKHPEGLGLGLSIASGVVAALRGTIEMESRDGRGTAFSLRLPAPACAAPPLPLPTSSSQQQLLRALLIEDSESLASLYRQWLSELGLQVTHLTRWDAALQWLEQNGTVDVLLCDNHLGAFSVLERGDGDSSSLQRLCRRRVVMTADDRGELKAMGADQAWHAFLIKPFGFDELATALELDASKFKHGSLSTEPFALDRLNEEIESFLAEVGRLGEGGDGIALANHLHLLRNQALLCPDMGTELKRSLGNLERELRNPTLASPSLRRSLDSVRSAMAQVTRARER